MALRTRKIDLNNLTVPISVLFEKILGLDEKLDGQQIKMKSIFNPDDNDPSMYVYFNSERNTYLFKDFSSGKNGDIITLIKEKENIPTRQEAFNRLLDICDSIDNIYHTGNNVITTKKTSRISKYKLRQWNIRDEVFWESFGIDYEFLKEYNIKPIDKYVMTLDRNGVTQEFEFNHVYCYGYFNNKNKLCKIYNPKNKDQKFIKISDMIQGEEQLKFNVPFLIIASSMKDIGSLKGLGLKHFEFVAPDSENTKIPSEKIDYYKSKYKKLFTLLDNDIAGMKAMKEYKEEFDIDYIHLKVEKDISDCVKEHGKKSTRVFLKPLLLNAIGHK